jgi:hypothetical protein
MSYASASQCTDSSPCTYTPIVCPLCPLTPSGCLRAIWKYNFILHLLAEHTDDTDIPSLPASFWKASFVQKHKEALIRIPTHKTQELRDHHGILGSDEVYPDGPETTKPAGKGKGKKKAGARPHSETMMTALLGSHKHKKACAL